MSQSKPRSSVGCRWESLMGFGALVAAAVVVWHFHVLLVLILAAALCARLALPAARFYRMSPAARRNVPVALWASLRWRFTARNHGLVLVDKHASDKGERKVRHPKAKFRADEHGFSVRAKVPASLTREDFEAAAPALADHWRCQRVSVGQPRPGRVVVHARRRDPLPEPFGIADAPPAAYTGQDLTRLYVGRDEHGQHRWMQVKDNTAPTVAGQPGSGKCVGINGLLLQWAPSPGRASSAPRTARARSTAAITRCGAPGPGVPAPTAARTPPTCCPTPARSCGNGSAASRS